VVVGYDGVELLDIAAVTTTLAMANALGAPDTRYELLTASVGARPVDCATGLTLRAQQALERFVGPLDTLVVPGGLGHRAAAADPVLVGHVRRLARESRRVSSLCTGANVLAAAGLLDGRRATTHWRFAPELAAEHPAVLVDPDPVFVRDGAVATSAGITCSLDLALAFVEEDHGPELARATARELVTYLQRPGNQAQMSTFTAAPAIGDEVVRRVVGHITADPAADLGTDALAAVAGLSARQLTRIFRAGTGQTPGRFVRRARAEAAAALLTGTSLPLPAVALRCGFGSAETLRLAFTDRFGVAPSAYRQLHRLPRGHGPA
jgi:transcriptional regulator GlxA family with amidase domain